jgi:hypothetical protein
MRDRDRVDEPNVERPLARAKRPYVKPKIRQYGSIAKLTQSGGSTKAETGAMMACL